MDERWPDNRSIRESAMSRVASERLEGKELTVNYQLHTDKRRKRFTSGFAPGPQHLKGI